MDFIVLFINVSFRKFITLDYGMVNTHTWYIQKTQWITYIMSTAIFSKSEPAIQSTCFQERKVSSIGIKKSFCFVFISLVVNEVDLKNLIFATAVRANA